MTKVYVLFNPGYDEDGGGDEGGKVIGVFSSRADAGRVQRVHSEADIEECKLDELAGQGIFTEWVVAINAVTGHIDGVRTKEVFGHTGFVPYGRAGAGFEARSRTSLEHAMKVAEEGGRKWLAPAPVESAPRSIEPQPAAVATCFYCRTGNSVRSSGDATGPTPNLWGYARDGAGELLCCSRCLADYHAGQPVRLVPMEHAADGKPEPAMAGGKATMVEPFTLPTRPWS